ncbi:MAG TPA: hypothetical protein VFS39_07315 [Nitrospira sp.]|nr:hypothetical protein [Nitrospira sp.]
MGHSFSHRAWSRIRQGMAVGAGLCIVLTLGMGTMAAAHDNHDRGRHSLIHYPGGLPRAMDALAKQVAALQAQVTTLSTVNAALQSALNTSQATTAALQARVAALESNGAGGATGPSALADLAKYVKIDPNTLNGLRGPHIIFTGVNVHVRSGSGSTDDAQTATGQPVGLGNLIVGYNEPNPAGGLRTGSHNIIGGSYNNFSSVGGLAIGVRNTIDGQYATVLGGDMNMASGVASSVLGGFRSFATAPQQRIPQ